MFSGMTSDKLIEAVLVAVYGDESEQVDDARARHMLRQALHGLARLARSEQLMAMRRDTARAAGASGRRQMRAVLRRAAAQAAVGQGQLTLALGASETAAP